MSTTFVGVHIWEHVQPEAEEEHPPAVRQSCTTSDVIVSLMSIISVGVHIWEHVQLEVEEEHPTAGPQSHYI
jgi:hypothetical protein